MKLELFLCLINLILWVGLVLVIHKTFTNILGLLERLANGCLKLKKSIEVLENQVLTLQNAVIGVQEEKNK